MHITIPEKVNMIIHTLQKHGYEAYAVGGCVRDSFLGRIPQDWDITTSATPLQTKALFPKSFDTGIEHGTITVLIGGEGFEVTTYRIDGEYEDNRHPKEVAFTRSLSEDLLRRDFTINAMAYNDQDGLVDIFGGMEDLSAGIIRCVGNAYDRFGEDALRILRAVRFSAQLGFEIHEETKKAAKELAKNLRDISAERIQVELIKLLTSDHPDMIRSCYELGITKIVLPEFDRMMETTQENPHHCYNVGEHTIKSLSYVEADKVLRIAMLLHDVAKPECKLVDEQGVAHFKTHDIVGEERAKEILGRLRFDNDTKRKVSKLVRFHDDRMAATKKNVRRAMHRMGEDIFPMYLSVRYADMMAQSEYLRKEKEENLKEMQSCYNQVLEKRECTDLKDLAVTGRDLIAAGMSPGREIGEVLNQLLEEVLEHPEKNTKEQLLEMINR